MSQSMRERADPTEPVVQRIVEAVAAETGADATDLTPLYQAIDPDTLESFVGSDNVESVSFRYEGFSVTVSEDSRVTLEQTA